MQHQLDLTIAIPVKNEELNLPSCISAIGSGFAKKIVIIDSGSTDKTKAIATQLNVEIVNFNWDGQFPKKRNWFLRNYNLQTKWVLFLDADEYLTEDFKSEVRKKLTFDDKAGYLLTYTTHFMGKPLKGGYPLRKLALFKFGAGEYEKIEEKHWSRFDMEIHEHLLINDKIGVINSKIDHRDFRGISHYVLKHDEYASWEAYRFIKLHTNKSFFSQLTLKQKFKYRLLKSGFVGPLYFCAYFIFFGGFIDGTRGFMFAMFKMSYFTQVYCKIKELSIPQ